ncbi:MAG: histidine kinase [Bacteroidota bacterium]
MRLSKKILLLVVICCTNAFSFAQQIKNERDVAQYRAIHWGLDEGLSQGVVWDMIKDVDGFMWFGTDNGLNRFDGKSFRIFYADPAKKNKTVAGNKIAGLIEDSLNNIWIGTDKDISVYNIKADSFRHFYPDNVSVGYRPFWATRNKIYYLNYLNNGAFQIETYDVNNFEKKILAKIGTLESDSLTPGVSDHNVIFDSGSNSVWMEQTNPKHTAGGLLQLSILSGKRTSFTWSCYKNIPNHSHVFEGMRFDRKRNSIWINSPDGLLEFTLSDKTFHDNPTVINLINNNYANTAGIDIDREGRIWAGTWQQGIIIYDPINHSLGIPFLNDSNLIRNVLPSNVSIYCDRNGIVWSGFWESKGIYQLLKYSPVVIRYVASTREAHGLSSDQVTQALYAGAGKIWMSTGDGINVFDSRTNLFEMLGEKGVPPGHYVYPINIDNVGKKAWIDVFGPGFISTLFEMDLNTKKCRPVLLKDGNHKIIPATDWINARAYRRGCIISASYDNQLGIFVLNDNDSTTAYQVVSLPGEKFRDIYTSPDDEQFFFLKGNNETNNITFSKKGDNWTRIASPLDSIKWDKIIYNKIDQSFWIMSEMKLVQFTKDLKWVKTFTEEDGLPGFQISNIIADKDGNIWFSTDRSLHQLNTKTGTVTMLSEKDGFEPQSFNAWSNPVKDDNDDLYFFAAFDGKGFDRVNPGKFTSPPSSVYVQSIDINQKPFRLSTGVNNLQEISLRYFENNITIKTGNIDYYSKGASKIRYKLESEGKTAGWQYAPDYWTILYNQLQPGKYRLVMQASNAGNEFNGPEKILLINISPAFWNTWWFRSLAIVCIAGLFYGLIRWRLQQRFRIQLERSEKEKQIAELQQQKTEVEMQALRAQMNPHFIFNSLNSINRFILQNDRLQASEYLTKFSKLVRMILQNSQSPLIPLESELESLSLYLEMEALRFNYHFDYKITVPKDLDVEILKVPPLILQPYVENAIWHGLMHKEEKGQLNIDVSQEEDHLYFRIADNGIGRKKAAEIAGKSATKHKSMGLRITANRIAMMQSSNGPESPVKINDLVEPDGTAAGTEVVIKLPVIEQE